MSAEGKSRETFDITVYTKYVFLKFRLGEGGVAAARQYPPSLGAPLITVYNRLFKLLDLVP